MPKDNKEKKTYLPTSVLFRGVVVKYADIAAPSVHAEYPNSAPKYRLNFVFPKDDKANKEVLAYAMGKLAELAKENGCQTKLPPFYIDGDITIDPLTGEEYKQDLRGFYSIRSSSYYNPDKPPIFQVRALVNKKFVSVPQNKWHSIRNGTVCHVRVKPSYYIINGNVGCTSYISEIIIVRQGEPIGVSEPASDPSAFADSELDSGLVQELGLGHPDVISEPHKIVNVQDELNRSLEEDLLAA